MLSPFLRRKKKAGVITDNGDVVVKHSMLSMKMIQEVANKYQGE
jgi:hypothetical protein